MQVVWVIGREFISAVRRLGRNNGVAVKLETKHGKGSHATLYYGSRKTTVKDRRKRIGIGLLSAMLDQLGLTRNDLK